MFFRPFLSFFLSFSGLLLGLVGVLFRLQGRPCGQRVDVAPRRTADLCPVRWLHLKRRKEEERTKEATRNKCLTSSNKKLLGNAHKTKPRTLSLLRKPDRLTVDQLAVVGLGSLGQFDDGFECFGLELEDRVRFWQTT